MKMKNVLIGTIFALGIALAEIDMPVCYPCDGTGVLGPVTPQSGPTLPPDDEPLGPWLPLPW